MLHALITVLAVISGLSEAASLFVAVRDAAKAQQAVRDLLQHAAEIDAQSTVLKGGNERLVIDANVERVTHAVADSAPPARPCLPWVVAAGILAGMAAGLLALWG